MPNYSHVGGWIQQPQRYDPNIPTAATDFSALSLNQDHVRYFEEYFTRYYHDRFVLGQGTEEILHALAEFGGAGRWLDLGCGPTTLFWATALDDIAEIHCADLMPEALSVLWRVVNSALVPPCYRHALTLSHKPLRHLREMRARVTKYLVLDTMRPWPDYDGGYDLITAIGNFGLAP